MKAILYVSLVSMKKRIIYTNNNTGMITPDVMYLRKKVYPDMLNFGLMKKEFEKVDLSFAPLYMFPSKIEREKYDIIGLTSVTSTFDNALDLARTIKSRFASIKILYGGIHATVDPVAVSKCKEFDFIAVGEAECTVVELVDAIMEKTENLKHIKGIVYCDAKGEIISTGARELTPKLDDYPTPAYNLIRNFQNYAPADATFLPAFPIMVSRGCPGQCTYCQTKNIFGRSTRFRSPQHVIDEEKVDEGILERHDRRQMEMFDDPFMNWSGLR